MERTKEGQTAVCENDLVFRVRRGEIRAFEQLVGAYEQRVLRVTSAILKNRMEAEEAAQDVFFTLFQKLDSFRGDSNLTTWIHRIAVNAALLRKRRDKSAFTIPLEDTGHSLTAEWSAPARDVVLEGEALDVIGEAVDRLDKKYQTVFRLRDVEGFSIESTARMLDLGIPAVKTRLHRARLRLRIELAGYFGRSSRSKASGRSKTSGRSEQHSFA